MTSPPLLYRLRILQIEIKALFEENALMSLLVNCKGLAYILIIDRMMTHNAVKIQLAGTRQVHVCATDYCVITQSPTTI